MIFVVVNSKTGMNETHAVCIAQLPTLSGFQVFFRNFVDKDEGSDIDYAEPRKDARSRGCPASVGPDFFSRAVSLTIGEGGPRKTGQKLDAA